MKVEVVATDFHPALIPQSTFVANIATATGGVFQANSSHGGLFFSACSFSGNVAYAKYGHLAYISSGTMGLSASSIVSVSTKVRPASLMSVSLPRRLHCPLLNPGGVQYVENPHRLHWIRLDFCTRDPRAGQGSTAANGSDIYLGAGTSISPCTTYTGLALYKSSAFYNTWAANGTCTQLTTSQPTISPTLSPTAPPTTPTRAPTGPTLSPTTMSPSVRPTVWPTPSPTASTVSEVQVGGAESDGCAPHWREEAHYRCETMSTPLHAVYGIVLILLCPVPLRRPLRLLRVTPLHGPLGEACCFSMARPNCLFCFKECRTLMKS